MNIIHTFQDELKNRLNASKSAHPRNIEIPAIPKKIKTIVGLRRVGKTYFLYQLISALLKSKINFNQILYINFEDERLLPINEKGLGSLIDQFYSTYPENYDRKAYLFLDEIQNIENWEIVLRRILDTKNVEIFITGSSSKMLSSEIATSLRGRCLKIEIWPFNFIDFLNIKHFKYTNLSRATIDKIKKQLIDFINTGGLPEVIELEMIDRINILKDYVDVVTYRDIIERYNLGSISGLKLLIKSLLGNPSALFSVNKFYNDLKSQGIKVTKDHIYSYMSELEDVFLVFSVTIHAKSIRKIHTNPKKIYSIDTGIPKIYSRSLDSELGHLFENLIFLDLKRNNYQISYYLTKTRKEIDFLATSWKGSKELIQIVWDITDTKTKEREELALKEAMNETGFEGTIVTPDNYIEWLSKLTDNF